MGPTTWRTRKRALAVLIGVVTGAAFVLPACSGTSDEATDAVAPAARAGSSDAYVSEDAATAAGVETATGAAGEERSVPTAAPRELVYTADLRVVARSVSVATRKVDGLVAARGGFVFGQESRAGSDGDATLTLKVPTTGFRGLLTDLAGLGEEASRSIRTEDVTDAGVDLDARILSAQRSVERVRAFLDEARNVGELSGVEAELTRRETELEQLTAQRRSLDDRVALATIELTLTERPEPVVAGPGDPLRGVPGFGDALATGVDWLVRVFRLAGAALGYASPFLVVAGVALVVRRLVRRLVTPRAGRRGEPDVASIT